MRDFEYAWGSIPGRHHVGQGRVLNGRNNQDASCCLSLQNALIAVVCDGCSDGEHSEFGAQLGARLIARSLATEIGRLEALPSRETAELVYDQLLERVRRNVLRQLQATAQTLGGAFAETMREYLLFTVVGAVVTDEITFVFSLGDGVFFVNGEATQLGPYPNNAPPYLAYALGVDRYFRDSDLRFTIQTLMPTAQIDSLLIGSDGLDDLIKPADSTLPGRKDRVGTLADIGKYSLMIWPYHAMLGGIGHALVPAVEQACFFHNMVRFSQTGFEIKGGNPLTENYSVLRPEVLDDSQGRPIAQKNTRFIRKLLEFDAVVIAGQAKSHCVAWTIDDLLTEIRAEDESLARKVYLLEDCTSPVVVPGVIDFTDQANEAFAWFADAGMHVVRSTEPLESWPGIDL